MNVLQARCRGMGRAVEALDTQRRLVLVDRKSAPPKIRGPVRTVVKGDALSASIAAASILAKVSRDRKMMELDQEYPQYFFQKHKGYGTALHYEMLEQYGISPVHRRSFLKKLL